MSRVLIVEDCSFQRVLLKKYLCEEGHEVVGEVNNGSYALEYYKKYSPDIVTLDIIMPLKDGIAALEEIMAYDPNAKVVICTSVALQTTVIKTMKSGAKDFIIKPLSKKRLINTINRIATA